MTDFVEGSIIGWAVQNAERVSQLREYLNEISPEDGQYEDNEALIVHMLDDVIEVYEDLDSEDVNPEAFQAEVTLEAARYKRVEE